VDLLTLWQHEAHTEFLQLQYAYGKSRGLVDTRRAFAHLRHRTAITPGWRWRALARWDATRFPGSLSAPCLAAVCAGCCMRWTRNLPAIWAGCIP